MTTTNKIESFLQKSKKWKDEMTILRSIVLGYDLVEEFKWNQPCYTFDGSNLIIISGFKDYCLLGFFNGAIIHDKFKLLQSPGQNSQFMRQLRFTSVDEIEQKEDMIKHYIQESISLAKSGQKVEIDKTKELQFPEELLTKFEKDPSFKNAFDNLTPGRQRAYNIFFTTAKQAQTRISRIEKIYQ